MLHFCSCIHILHTVCAKILKKFQCRLFHNATFLVPVLFTFYIQGVLKKLKKSGAVYFIMLHFLVPVLFTFYIQDVLKKFKKKSGAKRLRNYNPLPFCFYFQTPPQRQKICHLSTDPITGPHYFASNYKTGYNASSHARILP
jgi:hypothetical protein